LRNHDQRRPPLPDHLSQAERDFYLELRRLVDAAGLSFRALEEATSVPRSGSSEPQFYSKSQWGRWLNGQSLPPRKAVRRLIGKLAEDEIEAEHLVELWGRAFVPDYYPQEPGNTLARPQQLPIAMRNFIGRETQLQALTGLAEQVAGHSDSAVIVIDGTAGVGKTTLAIQFGHLIRNRFPDGQLYINMHGFGGVNSTAADEALHGFLEAFGVSPKTIPAGVVDQAAFYRSQLAEKRVLVVIDNAADAEQVRPLLPGGPGCLTLVTSRNRLTGLVAEGAHGLRLGPFTVTEARNLLARRIGANRVERESKEADGLISLCARLPLALSVAAAHAATHPEFSLAVLTRDFRGRGLDLLETGDPATTMRTVFSWSYRHLSDAASRTFRLLGIHPGPDINVSAVASLCGVPVGHARTVLDELSRANLLDEHVPGRFTFHDLLRSYASEQAPAHQSAEELAAAELRLMDHYLRTAHDGMRRMYPARRPVDVPDPDAGVALEKFATYEQALAWFRAERKVLLAAVSRAASRELDVYCWQLAWTLVPVLHRSGHLHEVVAMLQLAYRAAERTGDLGSLGRVHYELGHAYSRIGEVAESDIHHREALDLFTRIGDKTEMAQAHHGISILLLQQGRLAEALQHAQQALRLRRSFTDGAAIAYSENGVGWIQAQLGNYEEALTHCETALALHRESGSRSGAADTLDSIGFVYHRIGDQGRAIDHYQQAISIYQEIGDPNGQATTLTGLGDAQLAAGLAEAARRSWEEAIALQRQVPSANSRHIEARLAQLP
jgi:tetratricopeptide (TPR) repeat protein